MKKIIILFLLFSSLTISPESTPESAQELTQDIFELAKKNEWDDAFNLLDKIHDIPQRLLEIAANQKALSEATTLTKIYDADPNKEKKEGCNIYQQLEQHFLINHNDDHGHWEDFEEAAKN